MKIGIVDAFSTGKNLAWDFIKKGCECYHIRSTRGTYPFDIPFADTIYMEDDNALSRLISLGLRYIIAGAERGVQLADYLNHILNNHFANPVQTTLNRRNKYLTHTTLADKNLNCIAQYKSANKKDIKAWVRQRGVFPVVIKPLDSSASDGVTVCDDMSGVDAAMDNVLGEKNFFGQINTEILVQEFIEGTQYFVNTLSWDGQTYITDIWEQVRTRRKNQSFRFEGMKLCQGDMAIDTNIKSYISEVLLALDLRYGPAHNEIILTDDGPVLIESNARLMGASISDMIFNKALGYTQSSLCVDMYINPDAFLRNFSRKDYKTHIHLYEVSFLFKKEGVLVDMPAKDKIESLDSFCYFSDIPALNIYVKCTTDTQGIPGFLYLAHESKDIIERDFRWVLDLQKNDRIFTIL